eukprot:563502-Hanusia_phi.AAC.1
MDITKNEILEVFGPLKGVSGDDVIISVVVSISSDDVIVKASGRECTMEQCNKKGRFFITEISGERSGEADTINNNTFGGIKDVKVRYVVIVDSGEKT